MASDKDVLDIQAKVLALNESIRDISEVMRKQGDLQRLRWWTTNVRLLSRFAEPTLGSDQYCQGLAPRLTCQDEEEWKAFRRLKQRGIAKGGRDAGAFLVDLPPVFVDKQWTSPSEAPALAWSTNTLAMESTDIARLKVMSDKKCKFDIRKIGSYANFDPSLEYV